MLIVEPSGKTTIVGYVLANLCLLALVTLHLLELCRTHVVLDGICRTHAEVTGITDLPHIVEVDITALKVKAKQ